MDHSDQEDSLFEILALTFLELTLAKNYNAMGQQPKAPRTSWSWNKSSSFPKIVIQDYLQSHKIPTDLANQLVEIITMDYQRHCFVVVNINIS